MANVIESDYQGIQRTAENIRSMGEGLNAELSKAYHSVAEMHNSWYGKRYNTLVQDFNNLIPQINQMLNLVVVEIPNTLDKIAQNYSKMDTEPLAAKTRNTLKKISNLSISNDIGMRFLTGEVSEIQTKVSNNFKNSISKMNEIESQCMSMKWTSEAADAFINTFKRMKNQISSEFENINAQFSKLMKQALEDMENTEKANTVQ